MFLHKIIILLLLVLNLNSFASSEKTSIPITIQATIVEAFPINKNLQIKNNVIIIKDKEIKNVEINGKKIKKSNKYVYQYNLKKQEQKQKFIKVQLEI
ncbi:hypothetical protein [uncultured Cetobacterium sp.]|uniref:hypothetical protein n=1 Tax=uncultured Cetobacterium sp. TaxID=527638 RepID=UPI0026297500|nr:hypothetical protein [uncultured Cetobacterium sp.]